MKTWRFFGVLGMVATSTYLSPVGDANAQSTFFDEEKHTVVLGVEDVIILAEQVQASVEFGTSEELTKLFCADDCAWWYTEAEIQAGWRLDCLPSPVQITPFFTELNSICYGEDFHFIERGWWIKDTSYLIDFFDRPAFPIKVEVNVFDCPAWCPDENIGSLCTFAFQQVFEDAGTDPVAFSLKAPQNVTNPQIRIKIWSPGGLHFLGWIYFVVKRPAEGLSCVGWVPETPAMPQ